MSLGLSNTKGIGQPGIKRSQPSTNIAAIDAGGPDRLIEALGKRGDTLKLTGNKQQRSKSNTIKIEYKVCFVSILFGLVAGLIDAVLDYLLFHEGSFWDLLILDVPTDRIYSRCLVLLSFTLFGLLFAFVLAKHRRAEETLRDREAHFRSVVQTASDAIISADSQGNIVFWNQAAETLFGYSADEAVHQPLTITMPKRFHEAHQTGWQRFVATEEPIIVGATVEVVGQRKGGSEFPIELSLATWKTCEETFLTAIIRDVSERKQLEAQQEAARKLLQDTIDGIGEPLMVIGVDYQVKLMNQAVRNNYPVGTGAEPVVCYQVSHNRNTPCSGTEHPCPLTEVRESLCPATIVHEHVQKNGEKRLVEILVAPLMGENGRVVGIVESARDITERKQTEQALRESEQRYKTLYAENRELAEGLRRQFAQRGKVLRSLITAQEDERKRVARELHDELGQALSSLALQVGATEQLVISDPDCAISQLDDIRTLISDTTDQMYDIILALRPSALDELGLAVAVHTYANRLLTGTGIAFELDSTKLAGRLSPEIEITLYRVIQEALSNVIRHANASRVDITLAQHGSLFEGEIVDNGLGFDPTVVQVDGDSPRGLGLLGMQERIMHCGGQLDIISKPGSGTRLHIQIPLAKEVSGEQSHSCTDR